MQAMDWSDFQAFLAIARTGQLARAGRIMGMDATTIGRRLRRLESQMGATLFEQTREGQVLTPAGEKLLEVVERMSMATSELDNARDKANAQAGPSGTVRISVSEGFGSWVVARHLGDFAARYPGLTVDLVASNGFLSPSRREADIAVLLSRPKTGPLVARKLSNYALRLYASRDYLDRHKPILSPADLRSGHQLVGYVPELVYAPELNYLRDIDSNLAASLRSTSILAQHILLTSHVGVGVLPCFIGDSDPALVRVLPQQRITRSFWLVTHKDTHGLQRIRVTMDWLLDVVAKNARLLAGD
ncbi:LysR family transcriptional regulator [Novosphingobium rosa]|uniref:LysR family transcriptional regulator n=1 Tax=Novosphingobium rosa TaxID=76978 RepID=UPI000833B00F|nr:LysR family transcriptional regulator [Novosphingobium rosa]